MSQSIILPFLFLLLGIILIVVLTTRLRIHPFFALLAAALFIGLTGGLAATDVLQTMKEGFGKIMQSLGLLIVVGTTLGIVLEKTGRTKVIAKVILDLVGPKRATLAMSLTGFVVGMPIFCDSGFIVLSGLNHTLARRAQVPIAAMAACLATGLYAVHCLMPPHPGMSAAVSMIGADYGKVLLAGMAVAVPAMIVGYAWAVRAGAREPVVEGTTKVDETPDGPSISGSFLPIVVPIVIIAVRSFTTGSAGAWSGALAFVGDPAIAMLIGIACCLDRRMLGGDMLGTIMHDAIERSGGILVIIGAGAAFGHVLGATKIGEHFSAGLPLAYMGIFFPFLLTALLKTAQGSSTVAIITAASIVQPVLGTLGLDSETGTLLCALAMGAGSMMISHANDAYFWVISRFENIPVGIMLKVYSTATVLMALTSLAVVYVLRLVLLPV